MGDDNVLFAGDDFKVSIVEKTPAGVVHIVMEGNCSSPGFLNNSEAVGECLDAVPFSRLFIDAGRIRHANSRFIGILVSLLAAGKPVGLRNPEAYLADLLDVVGILQAFDVQPDFAAFQKACAAGGEM